MGIYDRDYYRRPPQGPGSGYGRRFSSLSMWSVTTWLILINVAVFFADRMLPPAYVFMDTIYRVEGAADLDPEVLVYGPSSEWVEYTQRGMVFLRKPLHLHEADGQHVGDNVFQLMPRLTAYLHFSTGRGFLTTRVPGDGLVGFEIWRLIGFQFVHAGGAHLLFNMLGLYFFGSLVEQHLGRKRYLAFYLLCGIFGALMYLMLNIGGILVEMIWGGQIADAVPGLLFYDVSIPLVGASAGVYGVLMAGAHLAPNATVLFYFVIPVRLRTFAYLLVIVAFITVLMSGANAGGEAGHLGGAIAGFYFIRRQRHLDGFFDVLGRLDPTSHHYRGKRKGAGRGGGRPSGPRRPSQVDRILDKVRDQGVQSLTEKEKRILAEESERR